MKITCCFCDAPVPAWSSLAKHLGKSECGRRAVQGNTFALGVTGNKINFVRCWCGFIYALKRKQGKKTSKWAVHMRSVGGLANHILELTMGEHHG